MECENTRPKKNYSSESINYYFYSREQYDPNMVANKADKQYHDIMQLQEDIDKVKKFKKKFQIGNDLIVASISLQIKLTNIT